MDPHAMNISEQMVSLIIKDYYKKVQNVDAFVVKDLKLVNHDLVLNIYVIIKGRETQLTRNKLEEIFKWYLDIHGLDFVDFRYIGNIRKAGYFVDEDTPVFQGIKLYYHNRVFEKKLVP